MKMGASGMKYAAVSILLTTLISNSTGIAAPQELSASDIPKIIIAYYE